MNYRWRFLDGRKWLASLVPTPDPSLKEGGEEVYPNLASAAANRSASAARES